MKRAWLLAVMMGLFACPAQAARLTDVADAVDGADGPVDINVSAQFVYHAEQAMITRERNTVNSTDKEMIHQNEFEWRDERYGLNINGTVGLYHDLEFHFMLPITIANEERGKLSSHWRQKYWGGEYTRVDPTVPGQNLGTASLLSDRVFGYGSWDSMRSGLGDMSLGFAYAPLSRDRDPVFPDWLLGFDLVLPTGKEINPRLDSSSKNVYKGTNPSGGVGERLVKLVFKTAISMRAGAADPYIGIEYRLPIGTGGLIKNPRHEGTITLGTEAVVFEQIPQGEHEPFFKVAFDFRLDTTLYGRGQNFNAITDPLAWRRGKNNVDVDNDGTYETGDKVYWEDDPRASNPAASDYYYYFNGRAPAYVLPTEGSYVHVLGTAGFYAILGHYFELHTDFSIGHDSNHFLSLPTSVNSETLRPTNRSGYNVQINETGARVRKELSIFYNATVSLGVRY